MKLILMQFLTVDGVSQGPGAPDEDTSDGFTRGGWLVPHIDDEFQQIVTTWTLQADAFLFGRRTYENFARDWPKAPDSDPVGAALNGLPKYVASGSLREAGWAPSTILSGDVAARVAELKQQPGRELQIHGSARLGQSMLAAGLVDELRLVIAPVVVGAGRRLFTGGAAAAGLRLTRNDTTPGGLAIQVFETAGAPAFGSYGVGA
jgi:dihydrofolate reductase